MFDAVLGRSAAARGRMGRATVLAIGAHAAVITAVIWKQATGDSPPPVPDAPLVFMAVAPQRASAPTSAVAPASPQRRPPATRRARPVLAVTPPAPQVEQRSEPPPTFDDTASDTTGDLVDPGTGDGTEPSSGPGGGGDGPPGPPGPPEGPEVLDFDASMTRPSCDRRVFAEVYAHSAAAREAHVEGTIIAQCEVHADGTVQKCRALKGLPHLTEPTLAALEGMRCTPATVRGMPVSIRYVQHIGYHLAH